MVGDIVGAGGRKVFAEVVQRYRAAGEADFVVANAENSAGGNGLSRALAEELFKAGELTRTQFDALAVAINTGTNIPSVATPNGQAAFLFLLTSALAPLIRLSYGRMVYMALPYTVTMSIAGLAALWFLY